MRSSARISLVASATLTLGLSALAAPAPAAPIESMTVSVAGITADGVDAFHDSYVVQVAQPVYRLESYRKTTFKKATTKAPRVLRPVVKHVPRSPVKPAPKPAAPKPAAPKPAAPKPAAPKPAAPKPAAPPTGAPAPTAPIAPAPSASLPAPVGSAGDHAFIASNANGPAHFDACSVVKYKVNTAGAPASFAADLATALVHLQQASGLTFVDAGSTNEIPFSSTGWKPTVSSDANFYIAWSDPSVVTHLTGGVVGVGGPWWQSSSTREPRIVGGAVVFDTTDLAKLKPGSGPGASLVTLYLHELGHAVGLGHVSADTAEVMYPSLGKQPSSQYQVGDRAGLTQLAGYSCF